MVDADGDGFDSSVDCDDDNADVNPDALELCDEIDNNCNGEVDEYNGIYAPTWYADDDGDGYDDSSDAFPLDSTEWVDYDNDGTGDNADTDDDNDGVDDATDAFDNDVDAWTDTDGDGLADDFPNLSETTWTTSSTLTEVGSGSASSGETFTLTSDQRATITMTNTDYYAYECGVQINGVAYSLSLIHI